MKKLDNKMTKYKNRYITDSIAAKEIQKEWLLVDADGAFTGS